MANLGYIQVTRICNARCLFCSNPDNGEILPYKDGCQLIDDFITQGYHGVIFTGGEPTLADHLPDLIAYAKERGIFSRMITNGQRICDRSYLKACVEAGLEHAHLSLYTCRPEIQNFLADRDDSFQKLYEAYANMADFPQVTVNQNSVINAYNADHLHLTVEWMHRTFPYVRHFVWNNLDPMMNRTEDNRHTVPALRDFEVSLTKAMRFLTSVGKTFRVERVPLCYMTEFAHCSTEARKIVKEEERTVHFLDWKGSYRQQRWEHEKTELCQSCSLDRICAGVHGLGQYYSPQEIAPVFVDGEKVARRILRELD